MGIFNDKGHFVTVVDQDNGRENRHFFTGEQARRILAFIGKLSANEPDAEQLNNPYYMEGK